MNRFTFLFLSAVISIVVAEPHAVFADSAQAENEYVESIVREAKKKNLASEKQWSILLHYQKTFFGGYTSEAFDRRFFNATDGRYNPEAELEATIRKFFTDPAKLKEGEEHPRCLFPARLEWLKKRLDIKDEMLPDVSCPRLENWLNRLDPDRVTLVFASYYMSSPASMYGHTLLRLDKLDPKGTRVLLDTGVNYAAVMDTKSPVVMAFKGIFGLFRGEFTIFPYYTKVQEYSNMDARDIWEYELSLTKGQIRNLMLHLWEVGSVNFRYFYFRENCSYELLALLEAGNPELRLTEKFRTYTVPSDTIKALYDNEGLVARKVYRPSILTKMNEKRTRFTKNESKVFKNFLKTEDTMRSPVYNELSQRGKGVVLDAYLDYLVYKNVRERKSEEDYLLKNKRHILVERSRIEYSDKNIVLMPVLSSPEQGHESSKIRMGGGSDNRGTFGELMFRPTYHDIMSDNAGYAKNSQIIYMETTLRHYRDDSKTVLDSLKLVDIISLTPYDPLFSPSSWKVSFGLTSPRDTGCYDCNSAYVNFGKGYAFRPGMASPILFYGMLDWEGEGGAALDNGYRVGLGIAAGSLADITGKWRMMLSGRFLRFPVGHVSNKYELKLRQRYSIDKNLTVSLDIARIQDDNESILAVDYYF